MKKVNLFLLFILIPFMGSFAQFRVSADGTANVSTTSGTSAFTGTHNSIGIKGIRTSYNTDWGYGIYGESQNFYTLYSVGVAGVATTSSGNSYNYGRAYGVLGEAQLAENGYNYGVFGRLGGDEFGAAIYGTTIKSDNGVQIGGQYAGYFNGNVYVTGELTSTIMYASHISCNSLYVASSDTETSSNMALTNNETENVSNKIATLSAIRTHSENEVSVVKSENPAASSSFSIQQMGDIHYSLSAEQMEAVYPELVYADNEGRKMVNYTDLIPLLVQSIAELKAEIAVLKGTMSKDVISKSRSNSTEIMSNFDTETEYLLQNVPNPWSTSTDITVNVPKDVVNAELCIYDLNGTLIYSKNILQCGVSCLSLSASDFEPGIYIYALIADGYIVDTKRMIVEK
ncbi:MAG: T9SS type A sorting domain-containing protein [Bacteroidaceae bacterium]|nr:T9SS type A sorting domain-containing protein [Bacteroidaceae bacterium]